MTIEFHCPECDKLLRTTDDKAGVSAPCSGCGAQVTVPFPVPAVDVADEEESAENSSEFAVSPSPEELRLPRVSDTCPMCGASVPDRSANCPACGESLSPGRQIATGQPTRIQSGDMFYRTWRVFWSHVGITTGGVLLTILLQQLITWPIMTAGVALGMPPILAPLLLLIPMISGIILQTGLTILLVKVAQGQPARISDLFAGVRFFWRYLGAAILFGMILIPAFILFIFPALIVGLMFWPVFHVIVIEDAPVLASFGRAQRLTQGNKLTTFVMWLALFGAQIPFFILIGIMQSVSPELGMVVNIAWMVLTMPFIGLLFAMTYTAMCGRSTAEQLSSLSPAN